MKKRLGPGLARMRSATPPGLCPFCLDPIPPSLTKPRKHCGDEECLKAYNRTYYRDRRRPEQPKQGMVAVEESERRPDGSIRWQRLECGHFWYAPPNMRYNKYARERACERCRKARETHGNEEE